MKFLSKNARVWWRGLVAAIVAAASNAITVMIVEPQHFNLQDGFDKVGQVALSSGFVGAVLYLKQHPLPDEPEALAELAKAVEAKQDAAMP